MAVGGRPRTGQDARPSPIRTRIMAHNGPMDIGAAAEECTENRLARQKCDDPAQLPQRMCLGRCTVGPFGMHRTAGCRIVSSCRAQALPYPLCCCSRAESRAPRCCISCASKRRRRMPSGWIMANAMRGANARRPGIWLPIAAHRCKPWTSRAYAVISVDLRSG